MTKNQSMKALGTGVKQATIILAAMLAFSAATGASAQNLLKPGQGLIGAPEPLPPEGTKPKPKDEDVEQLDDVIVKGQRDPLADADKKRREQAKKLPGLGTDRERKKDRVDKLKEWYDSLPKDANKLNQGTQDFLDGVTRAPDTNHASQYKTEPRRDAADYKDPFGGGEKK